MCVCVSVCTRVCVSMCVCVHVYMICLRCVCEVDCTHLPGLGANAMSLTGPYTPTRFCSLCHFLHRQTHRHKQTLLPRSPHCLTHSLSHHLPFPRPHHLTHSLSHHRTLPRPHHLTHSLSHHLTLPTHLACSLCSNTCTAEVCACGSSLPTTIIEG